MAQVASVAGLASVHVVEHDTFHHNVPQFLQQQGELVPLLKDEMSTTLTLTLTLTLTFTLTPTPILTLT